MKRKLIDHHEPHSTLKYKDHSNEELIKILKEAKKTKHPREMK